MELTFALIVTVILTALAYWSMGEGFPFRALFAFVFAVATFMLLGAISALYSLYQYLTQ